MPNIATQYRTIVAGSGFRPASDRGRLEFTGADRVSFLQALVTNDLDSLHAGQGAYAALLTPQGRMITDLHLFVRSDAVIVDVPASLAHALADKFDSMIFAEDVQVRDVSASTAQYSIVGGTAAEALENVTTVPAATLRALRTGEHIDVPRGFVVRTDAARLESYDVVTTAPDAAFVSAMSAAGSVAVSPELAEALRVDHARPAFGRDMSEETIPLEAGLLDRAISTTKGCYVGQELIVRVLHRGGGRVAKRLVKIAFSTSIPPAAGEKLFAGGKDVGYLTSVAESLEGQGWNALAYVQRESAHVGVVLSLGDTAVAGVIQALAG